MLSVQPSLEDGLNTLKEAADVLNDLERRAYFRTGRRSPQGPDLAVCQNLQWTRLKCFIRRLRRRSRCSQNIICSILHGISAFQVSQHYMWNISLRE